MKNKIYFWGQFLFGLLFLIIGIFVSLGWIWQLIIEPDGKMLLDWQFTVPLAFLSSLIFLELGLYLFYKIFPNNFFNKILKICNYLLLLTSIMKIVLCLSLLFSNSNYRDFFCIVITFIIIMVSSLIFMITLKLKRILQ
jgi:hypothetical protein